MATMATAAADAARDERGADAARDERGADAASPTAVTPAPDPADRETTGAPALIADIGGTNLRLALATGPGRWTAERILACADYPTPAAAIRPYLNAVLAAGHPPPDRGALCVAAPVAGDRVRLTNHGAWDFSIAATAEALGLRTLQVVNDFVANALAVPHLGPADGLDLGGEPAGPRAPMVVMGPGTGLGVALLVPPAVTDPPQPPQVIATEGGHVTLAATTPREAEVIALARTTFGGHCSAERLVSGPGLATLAGLLRRLDGQPPPPAGEDDTPARVLADGLAETCPIRAEAVALFLAFLGSTAGNLVLGSGAWGGLWLMGGILPRIGPALATSAFSDRFVAKGRFADRLRGVPRRLVTHPLPAFLGLSGLVAGPHPAPT